MSTAEVNIVPATEVADLRALEPLAREVFGAGQRAPRWFARKLHRECVCPATSRLVVRAGLPASDPKAWLGYGLVGLPPSLRAARTAGIGLIPEARGRGLGTRLVRSLIEAATGASASALRVPAPPDRVAFYTRAGLRTRRRAHTWLAFGRGSTPPMSASAPTPWGSSSGPPGPGAAGQSGPDKSAWFAEAWERTPAHQRYTVDWSDALDTRHQLDVSIEGTAHLVQRWRSGANASDAVRGLETWLDALPAGTPALLHHVDAVSSVTEHLRAAHWVVVQTTVQMQRELTPAPPGSV